ncbi:ATP synthase subunit a [Pirellulimonas nuda]|uniref:ATP synthase subunit a n=2 Tax=Pirellulimonas nuda TaxID=2528009 RepID=A0A518DAY1_9BACT|nr:ATP synthase subunit a [Pirellulimonas nuda]
MSPAELFSHVQDAPYFHFPRSIGNKGHVSLPQPFARVVEDEHHADGSAAHEGAGHDGGDHGGGDHHVQYASIWAPHTGNNLIDTTVQPLDLVFTKFMLLEAVVALICVALFGLLASRLLKGGGPRGMLTNLFEAMLVFIREQVAKPTIGEHDADRFVPFLWTIFFFVLGCNLLGMVPWMGTATGALATTAALALVTFGMVLKVGIEKMGFVGFLKAQVPAMDLPKPIGYILVPLIFAIEILGMFIKHFVLAVRLLANMMAGHIVLAVIVGFIALAANSLPALATYGVVAPAAVLGGAALSLLELFVAFLQAYIFTFLSALFIGAAAHPH